MPKTLRDSLVAVSLSNLCFLWAWQTLTNPLHYAYYYVKGTGSITEPLGLLLDVLILAGVFWGLVYWARRSKYRLPLIAGRWIFLLLLGVPIFTILHKREAQSVGGEFDLPVWALIAIATGGVLLLFGAYKWQRQVMKVAVTSVLILSPMVVINVGYSVWLLNKYGREPQNANQINPATTPSTSDRKKHIVWIIFDELDQHVTFAQRPAGLGLPEFDRLRGESFFASEAYPPARHTQSSMPALITGRKVVASKPMSPNELALVLEDQKPASWSTVKNVFSDARESGFSTALVGWYHPYCRVIRESLDFCAWEPFVDRPQNLDSGLRLLVRNMTFWVKQSFFRIPLSVVRSARDRHQASEHATAYRAIMTDGLRLAIDPNWNLVMIHFPIPHAPYIDAKASQRSTSRPTYHDNLALADDTIGQMRRAMESAQIWDASTIVVSSDHWWRERPDRTAQPDRRVPFILKLAGQNKGMVYERPMATLVTKELLLSILRGELSTPEDLVAWLDRQPNFDAGSVTGMP